MEHVTSDERRLLAEGVLDGADALRVARHLSGCAECREATLADWQDSSGLEDEFAAFEELIASSESGLGPRGAILEQLQRAENVLELAAKVSGSKRVMTLLTRVVFERGWSTDCCEDPVATLALSRKARRIAESIGDKVQAARARVLEAFTLTHFNETEEALKVAREATRMFEEEGEGRRVLVARFVEAAVYLCGRRYPEAAVILRELLAEQPADEPYRGYWLHALANCVLAEGDAESAIALGMEALQYPGFVAKPKNRLKAEWLVLRAAAAIDPVEQVLSRLRAVQAEATALELDGLAMCIGCDIADVLLTYGRHAEALEDAKAMTAFFLSRNLTGRARQALALLHEAARGSAHTLARDIEQLRDMFPDMFPARVAGARRSDEQTQ